MGEGRKGRWKSQQNRLISCRSPFSAFRSVSVNVKEGEVVQATDRVE